MFRYLFTILLFLCYTSASSYCPNGPEYDLPFCALHIFDLNDDGNITQSELNTGFTNLATLFTGNPRYNHYLQILNQTSIMEQCDMDDNGVLNMIDWDDELRVAPTSMCLTYDIINKAACRICGMTDWIPPSKPQSIIDAEQAGINATLAIIASMM